MIAQVLRLERPSLKWLPLVLIPPASLFLFLGGPKLMQQEIFIWGIFLPIIPLAGLLGMAKQWTCDPLIAVLPVPLRPLYLARVLTVLGTFGACWGAVLGIALLALPGSTLSAFQAANCTLFVGILPYLALQAWHLHRPLLPMWVIGLAGGLEAGPLMLLESWLRRQPSTTTAYILLGAILAATAIVLIGWWRAPVALIYQPRIQRSTTSVSTGAHPLSRRITPFLPILRSLYCWQYLIWLPILVLQGATQPGYFPSIMTGFALIAALTRSLWLQSVPVPRRPILLALLFPVVLALLAGHSFPAFKTGRPAVLFVESGCAKPDVAVPFDIWQRIPASGTPEIQAPWGETNQPRVSTLLGMQVFNPYSSGCDNSERFLQWQFRRAEFANGPGVSLRMRLLDSFILCCMALGSTLVVVLATWIRLRRLNSPLRWTVISITATAWLALASAHLFPNRFDVLGQTAAWLGIVCPNLAPWVVAGAMLLLYRMLEKAFVESEYTLKIPPQPAVR